MRPTLPEWERSKIVELAERTLWTDEGKDARDYLKKRRLSENTIRIFRLGYMPKDVNTPSGKRHEFAGRLIIPIFDQYGDLIALSSRDWRDNAFMKFYHESYKKGHFLFGLNVSKQNIVKKKKVIVVEGEMDVMTVYGNGLRFVVGTLGSSLRLYQLALLARYCNEIFIVFDGDEAGLKAKDNVLQRAKENDLSNIYNIMIVPIVLPNENDPDKFIVDNGINEFIKILKEKKEEIEKERL